MELICKNIILKINEIKNIFTIYFVGLENVRIFAPDFEREIATPLQTWLSAQLTPTSRLCRRGCQPS